MIDIRKYKPLNLVIVVQAVGKSNTHIYLGLGTFTAFIITALVVRKVVKKRVNRKIQTVDISIFDSPDIPSSGKCIDSSLLAMLLELEQKTGYPIFKWISSAVRSPYWNRKVGGVSNSSHKIPICKAVDIKTPSTSIRNQLVITAKQIGFKRIGVAKSFIHLDIDARKKQYIAWGYPKGTPPPINPFV